MSLEHSRSGARSVPDLVQKLAPGVPVQYFHPLYNLMFGGLRVLYTKRGVKRPKYVERMNASSPKISEMLRGFKP